MLNAADARRRWFGAFFLILAGGLLVWGMTFLAPVLVRRPLLFVLYWLFCFGLTGLSFAIAIYDFIIVRRRMRQEQKQAFEKSFSDVVVEPAPDDKKAGG